MAVTFPKAGGSAASSAAAQQSGGITFPKAQTATPDLIFTPGGARFTPFSADEFVATGPDDELDAAALEAQIEQDLQAI